MIVTRNNPYNNYYLKKEISKIEKVITNKQVCEEYQKIMKQKNKNIYIY